MSAVPYFYGESDKVTIVEGEVKSVSLTAFLASAVIRPQMAINWWNNIISIP